MEATAKRINLGAYISCPGPEGGKEIARGEASANPWNSSENERAPQGAKEFNYYDLQRISVKRLSQKFNLSKSICVLSVSQSGV
jgi:hypothetical protein